MNSFQRALYDIIYEDLKYMRNFRLFHNIHDVKMVSDIFRLVVSDAPGLFWVNKQKICLSYNGSDLEIEYSYHYTFHEVADYKSRISEVVYNLYYDKLSKCTSEFDIELNVHDYLTSTIEYTKTDRLEEHNIIGPLLENKGVCEGISDSFNFIMNSLGIDCMTIIGRIKEENDYHAWNIVYIEGKPYHVDVTFDLSGHHALFNLTDAELLPKREWVSAVSCIDTSMNYYNHCNKTFLTCKDFENFIYDEAKTHKLLEFKIDNRLDDEQVVHCYKHYKEKIFILYCRRIGRLCFY